MTTTTVTTTKETNDVHRSTTRRGTAIGLGLGVLLAGAAPASAHVSPTPSEVPAGGFTAVGLTVGHGCEESPTTSVQIQVPETILNVTPAIVPGWDVEVATEPLDEPVEGSHGEQITERESMVTYTAQAGNELPDGFRQTYTIGFQAPDTEGEYLFFKTIQICAEGQTEWIEEYTGEGEEPEHPSPAVLVTAAQGGHGAEEPDDEATETTEASEDGADEHAAAPEPTLPDDDDPSNGLAVVGLIAGLGGLALGGVALSRSGKTATS
jgi:periplasmic copper chaperone A